MVHSFVVANFFTVMLIINTKDELSKGSSFGLRLVEQLGHASMGYAPAAFRPLFTKGLALSGKQLSNN
jgi:hypothetical protein